MNTFVRVKICYVKFILDSRVVTEWIYWDLPTLRHIRCTVRDHEEVLRLYADEMLSRSGLRIVEVGETFVTV